MFDVCEWNDNSEARSLTQCLARNSGEAAAKKDNSGLSRKKRTKRNRELLEILHSLETPSIREQDSHAAETQTCAAQHVVSPDRTPQCEDAQPVVYPVLPSEPRLSRKQWRNKLKNKKQHKNKFKPSSDCAKGNVERSGEAGEPRGGHRGEKTKVQDNTVPTNNLGDHKPRKTLTIKEHKAGRLNRDGQEEERVAAKRARPEPMTGGTANKSGALMQRRTVQKLKKIMQREGQGNDIGTNEEEPEIPAEEETVGESPSCDRSTSLRSRMEERLSSARFRYINQQLYTSDSHEALRLFQNDPEAFSVYHKGFSQQVQHWPVNPVTQIIKFIKNRPSSLVVADFGCGDALIARSVRNTVHSFDLVALNDHVTVCDMSKVPLSDETVDIAVFCLSLMGKNVSEFLKEANRVLIPGGVLLLAEVSSRFDDIRQFLSAMSLLGFKNITKNTDNSHFFLFEFSKSGPAKERVTHPGLELHPCLYKKR
ncbi:ribosomal RNA-processing protein 8 [Xenopus laevis]|uniref:Ribosomal RNA-processing protein 8 n=2 Tax=Xenopus laevis TaxID=8355 RepID=A0A974DK97_XENLA|nr:ribosomal RNA-processing protein 8 [Xenopus laevis]OCT93489.1 hypothetical protein XELAEV_18016558mg [Xenopus laevis]